MTLTPPVATALPLAAPPARRAADRIVETLQALGVRWVFGVPGAKIDPVYDALAAVDSPRLITCRTEQGAASMAAAIGRLTGIPGVVLVTSGPGTSNLATGLITATTEGDPVVAICGAVRRADRLKRTHQTMDAVGLLSTVTKSAAEVATADNVPEAITAAFRTAVRAPQGAAAVVLPYDVGLEETTVSMADPWGASTLGIATDDTLARAAALLSAAEFPVILAGARAGADETVAALHRLLAATDLPVVETFQAAGIVSRDLEHHYLGRVGFARNQPGDVILHSADVVLAIGYDFVEYEPAVWNRDRTRVIVHLDEIAADVDDAYRPAVEAVGRIDASLDRLAALVDGLTLGPAARRVVDTEGARLAASAELTATSSTASTEAHGVDPVALTLALRAAVPDDTTVLCDVGSHYLYLARYFRTYRPRSLMFSNGQQNLGVALPWAIGASLARPGSPVLSVSGDGGFLYSAAELATAVSLGATFTHVIFNDGTYDMVAFQQMQKYGRTAGVELGAYDVVGFAEAFGAHGHRVTSLADLPGAIARAMAEPGPSLIDVPVDYRDNFAVLGADLLADLLV